MYREWPFFRTVIDSAQMALGKADMGIARLYAGLVTDASAARARVWRRFWRPMSALSSGFCA